MELVELKNITKENALQEKKPKTIKELWEDHDKLAEKFGEDDPNVKFNRSALKLMTALFPDPPTPAEIRNSPAYLSFFFADNNEYLGKFYINKVQYQWDPECEVNLNSFTTETELPQPYNPFFLVKADWRRLDLIDCQDFCSKTKKFLTWQPVPSDNLKILGLENPTQFKKILRRLKFKDNVGRLPFHQFETSMYTCSKWINSQIQHPELFQNTKLFLKAHIDQIKFIDCKIYEANLYIDISLIR